VAGQVDGGGADLGHVEECLVGDVGGEGLESNGSSLVVLVVLPLGGVESGDGGGGGTSVGEGGGEVEGNSLNDGRGVPPVELLATEGVLSGIGGVREPSPCGGQVAGDVAGVADGPVLAVEFVDSPQVEAS